MNSNIQVPPESKGLFKSQFTQTKWVHYYFPFFFSHCSFPTLYRYLFGQQSMQCRAAIPQSHGHACNVFGWEL